MRASSLSALFGLALAAAPGSLPAAEPAHGDIYFEQRVETHVDGQPAGAVVEARVWFQGSKLRLESGPAGAALHQALIVRLDQGTAFRLDSDKRTAQAIDIAAERERSRLEMGTAGDRIGAQPRIARLRRERVIAGYRCTGHQLQTDAGVIEMWLSTAVPADFTTFSRLLEWLGAEEALAPYLEALRRLPGFPLETRVETVSGARRVQTRATVTRLRVEGLPQALFEVPAGYRALERSAGEP